jgi:hypothetical protein
MMRFKWKALAIIGVLAAAGAASARADSLQRDSTGVWAQETECSREAFKHFPDYTPESNAKRENYRRACLRAGGLPAESGPATSPNN